MRTSAASTHAHARASTCTDAKAPSNSLSLSVRFHIGFASTQENETFATVNKQSTQSTLTKLVNPNTAFGVFIFVCKTREYSEGNTNFS